MTSMTDNPPDVSTALHAGIDTHKDTHHVAIVDHLGRHLGNHEFPSTAAGHLELISWVRAAGTVTRIGVEGTESYGSTLATAALIAACGALTTPPTPPTSTVAAASRALSSLAGRILALTAEERTLAKDITALVTDHAPTLLARYGIGSDAASATADYLRRRPGPASTATIEDAATSRNDWPTAKPAERSCAASNEPSPAKSSASSKPRRPLDKYRSIIRSRDATECHSGSG